MSSELEHIWYNITSNLPKPVSEWWWSLLLKKYTEDGRNCHNLSYLQDKLFEFENIRNRLTHPNAFALALFFQYFEYDPKDSESHVKNIDHFDKFATEAAILEEEQYKQVKYLLEASSIHSTDEHKTEGAHGEDDIHYFLDIDMMALGAQTEMYAQYVTNVGAEYSFLELNIYKALRKKVLQSFLLIPNIFATKEFKEKYEVQARTNIQKELDELIKS